MGIFGGTEETQTIGGRVTRIALVSWTGAAVGTSYECHMLLDGGGQPLRFGIEEAPPAVSLTQTGDEVRVEIAGEDAVSFENVTLGIRFDRK